MKTILWIKLLPLLALALFNSSCGTEIGNFAGAPTGDGLILTNSKFDYFISLPNDWLINATDLADVNATNTDASTSPIDLTSSIRIQAERLDSPITDLLSYLQNSQPGKTWESFETASGLIGVRNTETTTNAGGGIISELYFTNGPVFLKWDTVANEVANGDRDINLIVNSLMFTQ